MSDNNETTSGIAEILRVILVLQQNASCPESILDSCDKPILGCCTTNCCVCNTRPVMLYTCSSNGVPWSMPTCKDSQITCSTPQGSECSSDRCSCVFRVEKLDGNCATFRVLADNPDPSCCNSTPFIATNSFFTMNLNCVCAIKCLSDTTVDCV